MTIDAVDTGGALTFSWLWYSANFHPLERPNGVAPDGSGYPLCELETLFQRPVHSNPGAGGLRDAVGAQGQQMEGSSHVRRRTV